MPQFHRFGRNGLEFIPEADASDDAESADEQSLASVKKPRLPTMDFEKTFGSSSLGLSFFDTDEKSVTADSAPRSHTAQNTRLVRPGDSHQHEREVKQETAHPAPQATQASSRSARNAAKQHNSGTQPQPSHTKPDVIKLRDRSGQVDPVSQQRRAVLNTTNLALENSPPRPPPKPSLKDSESPDERASQAEILFSTPAKVRNSHRPPTRVEKVLAEQKREREEQVKISKSTTVVSSPDERPNDSNTLQPTPSNVQARIQALTVKAKQLEAALPRPQISNATAQAESSLSQNASSMTVSKSENQSEASSSAIEPMSDNGSKGFLKQGAKDLSGKDSNPKGDKSDVLPRTLPEVPHIETTMTSAASLQSAGAVMTPFYQHHFPKPPERRAHTPKDRPLPFRQEEQRLQEQLQQNKKSPDFAIGASQEIANATSQEAESSSRRTTRSDVSGYDGMERRPSISYRRTKRDLPPLEPTTFQDMKDRRSTSSRRSLKREVPPVETMPTQDGQSLRSNSSKHQVKRDIVSESAAPQGAQGRSSPTSKRSKIRVLTSDDALRSKEADDKASPTSKVSRLPPLTPSTAHHLLPKPLRTKASSKTSPSSIDDAALPRTDAYIKAEHKKKTPKSRHVQSSSNSEQTDAPTLGLKTHDQLDSETQSLEPAGAKSSTMDLEMAKSVGNLQPEVMEKSRQNQKQEKGVSSRGSSGRREEQVAEDTRKELVPVMPVQNLRRSTNAAVLNNSDTAASTADPDATRASSLEEDSSTPRDGRGRIASVVKETAVSSSTRQRSHITGEDTKSASTMTHSGQIGHGGYVTIFNGSGQSKAKPVAGRISNTVALSDRNASREGGVVENSTVAATKVLSGGNEGSPRSKASIDRTVLKDRNENTGKTADEESASLLDSLRALRASKMNPKQAHELPPEPPPKLPWADEKHKSTMPASSEPLVALESLSKHSDALYQRYASLRVERQKITIQMTAALQEPRAGPEYRNMLLDQQLSLNALTSSMDICFAKWKSIDVRKDDILRDIIQGRTEGRMKPSPRPSPARKPQDEGRGDSSSAKSLKDGGSKAATEWSVIKPPVAAEADRSKSARVDSKVEFSSGGLQPQQTLGWDAEPTFEDDLLRGKRNRAKGSKAVEVLGLLSAGSADHEHGAITLPDTSFDSTENASRRIREASPRRRIGQLDDEPGRASRDSGGKEMASKERTSAASANLTTESMSASTIDIDEVSFIDLPPLPRVKVSGWSKPGFLSRAVQKVRVVGQDDTMDEYSTS